MIRIGLIDDHDLVREGIKALLALSGVVSVGFEARDGEAVLAADLAGLDLLLMDLRMPGRDGLSTLRELRRRGSAIQVVLLTTFDEPALFEQAVAAGVSGYLRKDISPEALIEALRRVHAGGRVLAPAGSTTAAPSPGEAPRSPLSERERAVLRLLAGGYSNREIASLLFLAEGTVKNHVSSLLDKLDARDRTQAVLRGIALHLV